VERSLDQENHKPTLSALPGIGGVAYTQCVLVCRLRIGLIGPNTPSTELNAFMYALFARPCFALVEDHFVHTIVDTAKRARRLGWCVP
jgi:hypothetical protein